MPSLQMAAMTFACLNLFSCPALAQENVIVEVIQPLFAFILGVGAAAAYCLLYHKSNGDAADSEERSHAAMLFSSAHVFFYYHNLETHKEWFSRRLRQMLSIAAKNPSFDQFGEVLQEHDFDRLKQAVVDLKAGSDQVQLELRMRDGRIMECTGILKKEKQVQHLILWWQDISDRLAPVERLKKENSRLKQDLQHFSNTLNALPIPVWQRDDQLKIRYCNLAFMEAVEESTSSSGETMELHSAAPNLAKKALASQQTEKERRYVILHGERKPFDIYEIPWSDRKYLTGMALDISEMDKVREEMEHMASAQNDLLENAGSAMAIYGPDQRLKYHNSAFATLWQLEEAWLATHPRYSDILEKLRESRSLPEQANFQAFKQQQLKMFTDLIAPEEEYYYLPDGKTLRALATPHAMGGVLFAYEDVTDRLALERSYNTLIAVQKETLDNLHEGVAVFGEDGRLKLSNPVYISLWNLSREIVASEPHISDLLNRNRPLFQYDEWDKFSENFISLMSAREPCYHQIERTDGKIFEIIFVPLPDGQTLLNYVDITDSILVQRSLREKNDALEQADRLKSEFLANISYELRSPLTSISGFTEMLQQDYFGRLTEQQQEYLSNIQAASHHLSSLIDDILDIASIEAGYMDLNLSQFGIEAAMQSLLETSLPMAMQGKLDLHLECSPEIGTMEADESRIKQVMVNLLQNALKYTEPGGKVSFGARTGETEDQIILWVEDTGMGIAEEDMGAIFDKFYRTANASRKKTGTGLGLSMVKSFVELHGGRVRITSKLGEGTQVYCHLPRRQAKKPARDAA